MSLLLFSGHLVSCNIFFAICYFFYSVGAGELFERVIGDDFVLTENNCIHFVRQICEGVSYMHNNSILHLDLKPENILCVAENSNR